MSGYVINWQVTNKLEGNSRVHGQTDVSAFDRQFPDQLYSRSARVDIAVDMAGLY